MLFMTLPNHHQKIWKLWRLLFLIGKCLMNFVEKWKALQRVPSLCSQEFYLQLQILFQKVWHYSLMLNMLRWGLLGFFLLLTISTIQLSFNFFIFHRDPFDLMLKQKMLLVPSYFDHLSYEVQESNQESFYLLHFEALKVKTKTSTFWLHYLCWFLWKSIPKFYLICLIKQQKI